MFQNLGQVDLKSGERVQMGVVIAPDATWADRIEQLLVHKGEPWNWQNSEILRMDVGVDARFYILHREGNPFANIMTVEANGVGILGHVWTKPADRRKGAISLLMEQVMNDFRERSGKALCLGTTFDSPPFYIYRSFGFEEIEAASDYMMYYADSRQVFEKAFYQEGPLDISPLAWRDWPLLPFLFTSDFPGVVRCAPLRLFGRQSSEEGILPLLQNPGKYAHAAVLRHQETYTPFGFAACLPDAVWPNMMTIDVYCVPGYWSSAAALLEQLHLPQNKPCVAYNDASCPEKTAFLNEAGFTESGCLKQWVTVDAARTQAVDLLVYRR